MSSFFLVSFAARRRRLQRGASRSGRHSERSFAREGSVDVRPRPEREKKRKKDKIAREKEEMVRSWLSWLDATSLASLREDGETER